MAELMQCSVVVYLLRSLSASAYESVPSACFHSEPSSTVPMYASNVALGQHSMIILFLRMFGALYFSVSSPRKTPLYLKNSGPV